MTRFEQRTAKHEAKVKQAVTGLFEKQGKQLAKRVAGESKGGGKIGEASDWEQEFIDIIMPLLKDIVSSGADDSIEDYGLGIDFDVSNPNVNKFLKAQAQRFATEVNATTWDDLKASLAEGNDAGESLVSLAARMEQVMGDRIASSAETIARTEVLPAYNKGSHDAWEQSGVVSRKQWLAAIDNRTRDAHAEAHGQTVGLDEAFQVGGESLMFPGDPNGSADNVINCRCTMIPVLD